MFRLTLTGADQWTDTEALVHDYEGVEFGLLYSKSNTGNRYPSVDTLLGLLETIPNPALHVCGGMALAEMRCKTPEFQSLIAQVGRIQVNGLVAPETLAELLELYPDHTIITQHRFGNIGLTESTHPRHCILVDGSQGRGILPEKWEAPQTSRQVGFAGGLNPENLRSQLDQLALLNLSYAWWVDMETGLRTDDRFDVVKARAAIDAFRGWLWTQSYRSDARQPEVWIDHDYGECFSAWGHHEKPAMMAAAKAHVLETEGPSDWEVYEEDLEHSPVEHRWAWMADGSDPQKAEEFKVSKERKPSSKPITNLRW